MVVASGSIAGNIIDLLPESPLKHRFGMHGGRYNSVPTMLSDQNVGDAVDV